MRATLPCPPIMMIRMPSTLLPSASGFKRRPRGKMTARPGHPPGSTPPGPQGDIVFFSRRKLAKQTDSERRGDGSVGVTSDSDINGLTAPASTRDPERRNGVATMGTPKIPLNPGGSRVSHLWSDGLGTLGTRSLQIILVVLVAAGLIFAMTTLSLVVLPLLLGIILCCALWPLVKFFRRWLSPMGAAWTVLLGAFLILGGVLTGIVATVMAQWDNLSSKAQQGFAQVKDLVQHLPINIDQAQIDEWIQQATKFATSAQFGQGALSGISAAGSFFTGAGLLFVIMFFFLKDGDKIWQFFMSWVPERVRPTWQRAGARASGTFGGYARGTSIVAAVDALGIGLVMVVVGVPLAFPLAIIVFLGSYIPMVGATVAGILSVLVTLVTTGTWQAIAVAIGTIVVQQLEGNLLQPVVMGNTLHLHGLVILVTLTGGTVLGGIVGALISVPLVAATWAVVKVVSGRESALDDPQVRKRHEKAQKKARKRLRAAKRREREEGRGARTA